MLQKEGGMYIDLWKASVLDMRAAGLKAEKINVAEQCTHCDREHFFLPPQGPGQNRRYDGAVKACINIPLIFMVLNVFRTFVVCH